MHRQGNFTYGLGPLEGDAPGWRYVNEASPCPAVNILSAPAATADFEATHVRLSTAPDSGFVRTLALLRRDAHGVDTLRGRVLSRIDPGKGTSERVLDMPGEFWAVVGGLFERQLDDLTAGGPGDAVGPGVRGPREVAGRPGGGGRGRRGGGVRELTAVPMSVLTEVPMSVRECRLGACPTPPDGPAPHAGATAP